MVRISNFFLEIRSLAQILRKVSEIFFFEINMGVRVSLRVSQLILHGPEINDHVNLQ